MADTQHKGHIGLDVNTNVKYNQVPSEVKTRIEEEITTESFDLNWDSKNQEIMAKHESHILRQDVTPKPHTRTDYAEKIGDSSPSNKSEQFTNEYISVDPKIPLQTDIMALGNKRDGFLNQYSKWFMQMPMSNMFIVVIEDLPKNKDVYKFTKSYPNFRNGTSESANEPSMGSLVQNQYTRNETIFMIQKATLPQEDISVSKTDDIEGLGMMHPFQYTSGRQWQFLNTGMDLEFLETNLSFVDFVLRPWAIQISQKGLIADGTEQSFKTRIKIFEYQKVKRNIESVVRKEWTFENAYPVNVQTYSLQMASQTDQIKVSVKWAFSHYDVKTETHKMAGSYASAGLNEAELELVSLGKTQEDIASRTDEMAAQFGMFPSNFDSLTNTPQIFGN